MKQSKSILVHVSGPDGPGITASLMDCIVESEYKIVDMGQSVTHGLLSLSILILCEDESKAASSPILKDLLFEAKRRGLSLDFEIISNYKSETRVGEKFILYSVAPDHLQAGFIKETSHLLASKKINILRIDNVSQNGTFKSLEFTTIAPQGIDWPQIKHELMNIGQRFSTDVAFLKDNIYRTNKRLIVFDMDSTLIQAEVIDEMAKIHGVKDQVMAITDQAMNGEIDFDQSLKQRVMALKGLELDQIELIFDQLPLTPGVDEFIKTVKNIGYKVALITGGFSLFANKMKDKLGLDYAFANELEILDRKLTGNIKGNIINAEQKAMLLDVLAQQEKISLDQVVAIGDGANDIPMLEKAGLGIAFHAKDIVKKQAKNHMSFGPMTTILYFLGIKPNDERNSMLKNS